MTMKKKIISLALIAALAATAVVGGTLAYFTDVDSNSNVFTMGNIDIVLDEEEVKRVEDEWVDVNPQEENRVQANTYENVYPGAVLPKDPTVHNEGSYGAFVRVKVTVVNGMTMLPMYAEDDTLTDDLYNECLLKMIGELGEGWSVTDGIDADEALKAVSAGETDATFIITYDDELTAGADTTPVFENVTIPADWDQDDARLVSIQNTGFEVNIVAEAIQADGFADVTAAFAAYDAQ